MTADGKIELTLTLTMTEIKTLAHAAHSVVTILNDAESVLMDLSEMAMECDYELISCPLLRLAAQALGNARETDAELLFNFTGRLEYIASQSDPVDNPGGSIDPTKPGGIH